MLSRMRFTPIQLLPVLRCSEWNECERSGDYSLSPSDGERAGVRGLRGSEVRGAVASTRADAALQKRSDVPRYTPPLTLDPSPNPMGRGKPQRQVPFLFHSEQRRFLLPLLLAALLCGCATMPKPTLPSPAAAFPADALITQRGVLTVRGRQFTLNGYLARSATGGQRLIVTENFGNVLADVLVKPDGAVQVMRSSRAFKAEWIRRYMAADLQCVFGGAPGGDCPGKALGPGHFLIERRGYQLELRIVETKPGPQPPELFDATKAEKP